MQKMKLNKQQFWIGVSILVNNYHAINRKLFACTITKVEKVAKNLQALKFFRSDFGIQQTEEINKSLLVSQLLEITKDENPSLMIEGFIIQFKCIPKKGGNSSSAVGFIDLLNCSFRLLFESDLIADFEIRLNGELTVDVLKEPKSLEIDSILRWRDYLLKPKFRKWCLNEDSGPKIDILNEKTSLRLIDLEKYNELYNLFKQKYSECAMKFWNDAKESTDPLKYIYEDLAIAAYLITFWQNDLVNEPPKAFADLGCGNGLLVYILIEEGYQGYGYDLRGRKLWSLYPDKVTSRLFEQVIEPFKFDLPADVDWLIGNHSDELSPWLPVLASTFHKGVNFFLLPCCPFEFSGNKFQRRNSSVSGYKDFCDYAERISNVCGLRTFKDRLKIPSTKRNAIIGLACLGSDNNFLARVQQIKDFVKNEQQQHANSSLEEFKFRDKTEPVRNCTQIGKSIIESLVKDILFLLLTSNSNYYDTKAKNSKDWQVGTRLTMGQIAKSLDREKLKKIKSECGGLKTLLRNKHEIFQFEKPDFVLIRRPQPQAYNTNKPQTIKKRECFFKLYHPQGCPLLDDECTFIH